MFNEFFGAIRMLDRFGDMEFMAYSPSQVAVALTEIGLPERCSDECAAYLAHAEWDMKLKGLRHILGDRLLFYRCFIAAMRNKYGEVIPLLPHAGFLGKSAGLLNVLPNIMAFAYGSLDPQYFRHELFAAAYNASRYSQTGYLTSDMCKLPISSDGKALLPLPIPEGYLTDFVEHLQSWRSA